MKRRLGVVFGVVVVSLVILLVTGNVGADLGDQRAVAQEAPGKEAPSVSLSPSLPLQMPYQGVLRDSDGNLVNGSHQLTFTIYAYSLLRPLSSTWWNEVYSEVQTVSVTDGLFNVFIGAVNPLDPDIFDGVTSFGGDLELGITVDRGTELTPRTKILPVAYAYRAHYVNKHPRPSYDSPWRSIAIRPDPIYETFTHNLGGDRDDYLVDLQCRIGGRVYQGRSTRAYVSDITSSKVDVWVAGGSDPDAIRVRIWKWESPGVIIR